MNVYNFTNCYNNARNTLGMMEVKKDLFVEPPTLYRSWITPYNGFQKNWKNALWSDFYKDIDTDSARFFSFDQETMVQNMENEFAQKSRNDLMRCMAVAIKCHFFLFYKDVLAEPPSVIQIPDLSNLSEPRFAIIYPFLASRHALIVSRADLSTLSATTLSLVKFPVIIPKNNKYWLNISYWKSLSKEAEKLQMMLKGNKDQIQNWKDRNTFPFGNPLDIEQNVLPDMRQTGIRWAEGIKSWYLPKGYDLPPVIEYLDYLNHRAKQVFSFWDLK